MKEPVQYAAKQNDQHGLDADYGHWKREIAGVNMVDYLIARPHLTK